MTRNPKRPLFVTWLLVLVLIFTGGQWLRFGAALADWDFLATLPLRVPPWFIALSGLVWAGVGSALFVGLWRRASWMPRAAGWAALAFSGYYWLDRLLLAGPGPAQTNRPFALFATLGLLVGTFAILRREDVQAYFGDNA